MSRYYLRDYDEGYYIFDSSVISETEFDEKLDYDGYELFSDSLTGDEVCDLLNENDKLKKNIIHLQRIQSHKIRAYTDKIMMLTERNNRQYEQLDELYCLIRNKDWKALWNIIEERYMCEKIFQLEMRINED